MCVWCVCRVFVVCVVRLGCVWWMLSCLDARPACDVAMLRSVVCCRRPLAWSMRTTRNVRHAMCDVCERSMSMVNGRRRSRVCGCARQLGAGCFARSMRAGRVSPGGGGRRRAAPERVPVTAPTTCVVRLLEKKEPNRNQRKRNNALATHGRVQHAPYSLRGQPETSTENHIDAFSTPCPITMSM